MTEQLYFKQKQFSKKLSAMNLAKNAKGVENRTALNI